MAEDKGRPVGPGIAAPVFGAAIIYSLVASCKLCKIDPFAYLQDVLDRVRTHPASQIAQLIPANWKPSNR